jgi:hypothetical protein
MQDETSEPEPQFTRVCRKCSTQTTGGGAFCPNCGTRFDRRRRLGRRGKRLLVGTLALCVVGGAITGVLVKRHNDDVARQEQAAQQRAEAAEQAAREQARKAAAARRERERAAHELDVLIRKSLVKSLQRSVTKDATESVNEGFLEGPILRTECTPVGGGNIDDTAQHTGRFDCLAVSTINGDGTMSGYQFSATVNYEDSSYTWHLGR